MKFANDNRHSLIDFSRLKRTPSFAKTHLAGITSLSLIIIMLALILLSLIPSLTQVVTTPHPVQAATQIVVYNSSGTWTVPSGVTSVQVLVVAGGGGGGGAGTLAFCGGGGGAGGVIYNASYPVTPLAEITVTVGAGGSGGSGDNRGNSGGNSVFGTLTATGGGGGGGGTCAAQGTGGSGGSGGGGSAPSDACNGGSGTSGQGNTGGKGKISNNAGGGGGGNGSVGEQGGTDGSGYGGDGGAGTDYSSIFGTSGIPNACVFAGGGGGAGYSGTSSGSAGGGDGSKTGNGGDFTVNNTGSGGGGAYSPIGSRTGGKGAYGCVVIKYTTNSAPTVTSVTLQQSDKATSTNSMTPQTAYNVEIVAGDADTINDINQIDIWVFRDDNAGDDGAPAGTWDCDHEAIYRWAKSGSTWSMQNGAITTTWSITTGSCDTPGNMAATSGEWNLYFTIGKLAQESDGSTAEWNIKITVMDSVSNTISSTIYSKSMGAYSSLALSDSTISFGNIALGGTAAIQTPVSHYITLQAIANDAFALGSKSSSTWINGGDSATLDVDGSPAAGYFSLTQDDAGDGSGHPTTPQYVTASTVTITGHSADARTSTAAGASESTSNTNIYMDCILGASGLKVVTYSGTITFTITNS